MTTLNAPNYLFEPADKPALPLHTVPVITADDRSVKGYGVLVDRPDDIDIEMCVGRRRDGDRLILIVAMKGVG